MNTQSRIIEVFAVVLLAAATVASAWCAYQSSQWNGEEASLARQSTDQRVEATRLFTLGTQGISYDGTVAAGFAEAYVNGNTELQDFYRNVLARPDFVPTLDQWVNSADQGGNQLGSLLTDQDYVSSQLTGYNEATAKADQLSDESETAGDNGDAYIVLTLVLAGALFFAGVTSSFRSPSLQLALLAMSGVLLAISVGQIVTMPVQ